MKVPFYSRAVFLGIISLCSCASPTSSIISVPTFQIHGHFSAKQLIDSDPEIKYLGELNVKKIQCANDDPNPIVYMFGKVTNSNTEEIDKKIGGKLGWETVVLSGGISYKKGTKMETSIEFRELYDLPDYIDFNKPAKTIVAKNFKQHYSKITIIATTPRMNEPGKITAAEYMTTDAGYSKKMAKKELDTLNESRKNGYRFTMSNNSNRPNVLYPYHKKAITKMELEFRREINKLIINSPTKDECLKLLAG